MARLILIFGVLLALVALGTAEVAATGTASQPRLICYYISKVGQPQITPCPSSNPTPTPTPSSQAKVATPTVAPTPTPSASASPLPMPPNTGRTG